MNHRLLVHVEGQTEESFVRNLLAPELRKFGYVSVHARLIGSAQQRARRGGTAPWSAVRQTIIRHLREDREAISTTMVDYYGLPRSGGRAWPGRSAAIDIPLSQRAESIEACLADDIWNAMGPQYRQRRFIPYVMMHEFEALLFSDCGRFSSAIGKPELKERFEHILSQFDNPEEIDDSRTNAPSKRIQQLVPTYEKPLFGIIAALEIGLGAMLQACPHFSSWWERLIRET